ncbi:MAG TPA: MdtA/MuxA family multidrug efflux RND transporter periplasmic adaptor subunit [Usitatibacter sp.]|nr:MdtA/MuxA family multidrug efflux RND transporter periplasmic adaptor subunit [Usitatibacter sp.]
MSSIPPDPAPVGPPRRRWIRPAVVVGVLALAAIGAGLAWRWTHSQPPAAVAAKAGAPGGGSRGGGFGGGRFAAEANRVQPVTAVAAKRGDVNVVQTALGTVVALRTVTVRPRVDGLLQEIDFADGTLVNAGAVLARIDPAPFQVALEQAEGQLARDAAQLANARVDLDRYRTLLAQDSIASQQVDQQAALVKQLEGTVKVDQAAVDNARLQLSYTRITAPITGRLGLRLVDAGNIVHSSDANGIAVITQVHPITVLFAIPQDALPRVLERMRAGEKLAVEAWDRDQKTLLERGTLASIDNQIDVTTGTVKLKAELPNPEGRLFPNQFVNVLMVVDTHRGVVVAPSAAIQRNSQGSAVWVVRADDTATLRPVATGPVDGAYVEIDSGLEPGERVVTDGVDRIREGAKVEVVTPGAAAPGAASGPAARGAHKRNGQGRRPREHAGPGNAGAQ